MIAALGFSAPAGAVRHRVSCHPRGATTAAQNAKVRAFWVGQRLYACKSGGRRPLLLAALQDRCPGSSSAGCDDATPIRVSGRFVAVARYVEDRDHDTAWVDVFDVVNRKRTGSW